MATGRFAPSPTGPLHLGSLRTALLAWLFARSAGSPFLLRVEDLDLRAARPEIQARQLADLAAIGLDWDGPVVRQRDRLERYDDAIARLVAADRTYPCYCTRREIAEAASAPHGPTGEGRYPGTCRELSLTARRRKEAEGRPPALRIRADDVVVEVVDRLRGAVSMAVDDFVVRRNDGTPAYNLAVVVDDEAQGIEEVVRGDDLLPTTPRQRFLGSLLGCRPLAYAHVPLVVGPDGVRLAKRHGSVTLEDLHAEGWTSTQVLATLAASLGSAVDGTGPPRALAASFDPARLPGAPWVLDDPPMLPRS